VVEDGVSVVGAVGEDVGGRQAVHQRQRLGGVVPLTGSEDEAQRATERVDRDVPLTRQSSSRTPQSLVRTAPF
jgi:hypothetical protein